MKIEQFQQLKINHVSSHRSPILGDLPSFFKEKELIVIKLTIAGQQEAHLK